METRSGNLENMKQKIYEYIEVHGPSLPIKLATYFKKDSIIVSAFLAELLGDKKIVLSNLRVGNSPLYYIRGQEFQLEKFSEYLGSKEKEAFGLLKEKEVLEDGKLVPAIRVAIRGIKDFAFPLEYDDKLYWRYLKINDQNAIDLINNEGKLVNKNEKEKQNEKQEDDDEKQETEKEPKQLVEKGLETQEVTEEPRIKGIEIEKKQTEFIEKPVTKNAVEEVVKDIIGKSEDKETKDEIKEEIEEVSEEKDLVKPKKIPKSKVKEKSDFVFDVEEFLEKNDFILDNEIDFKKKEYNAHVKVDSQLGKIKMLCIAKDKKSINENDLNVALQKGNEKKLPVLLIARGEPNKKALERLEEIGNLVFWKVLG